MKTIKKKPVPHKWYYEWIQEMEQGIKEASQRVSFQQKRIDYVYLENAKKEEATILEKKQKLKDFINKYQPEKVLKGNLDAAKLEAKLHKIKYPHYFDGNSYKFFHRISEKYYLSQAESNKFMDYMNKLGIL